MKNWSQNLLFILFSFLFMGLGMLLADFYIKRNGNPFKQERSVAVSISEELYASRNEYPNDSNSASLSLESLDSAVKTQSNESENTLEKKKHREQEISPSLADAPKIVVEKNIKRVTQEQKQPHENHGGNIYVVTGVFGKESNVKAMIQKLKHFGYNHAFGFPRKKLTAVTAGSFSEKEARIIKARLTSKGLDAVVMEK